MVTSAPFYSSRNCECCGSGGGNQMYECDAYNRNTREVQDYDFICEDCAYYVEYGQLDDMTMMEIERDNNETTD